MHYAYIYRYVYIGVIHVAALFPAYIHMYTYTYPRHQSLTLRHSPTTHPCIHIRHRQPAAMSSRAPRKCSWCSPLPPPRIPIAPLLPRYIIYVRRGCCGRRSRRLPWRERRSAGWRHELAPNPKSNRNLRSSRVLRRRIHIAIPQMFKGTY